MNGYAPRDAATLVYVALVIAGTLLAGLALTRLPARKSTSLFAWLVTAGATAGVERLCAAEPAGLRMLAIIAALLYGMKGVIGVEARGEGAAPLSAWRWLGFAALWPGMRPAPFANAGRGAQRGAWRLIGRGWLYGGFGFALAIAARAVWHDGGQVLSTTAARVIATLLLMPALSLILHFGIFNVLAGLWRLAGVDARPLFRAPLAARSLEDFWSRRWNLAFSEMTALGVYRPLSDSIGRKWATAAAFAASGLLHELAISVPVLAGFGLPFAYFLLHAALVLLERAFARQGRPVSGWGWWSHLWVLAWLAIPAPILFHPPFLRGVIWPFLE